MGQNHHGDPGMHMVNDMWHYFSFHHWSSWIIILILVLSVIWLIKTVTKKTKSKE